MHTRASASTFFFGLGFVPGAQDWSTHSTTTLQGCSPHNPQARWTASPEAMQAFYSNHSKLSDNMNYHNCQHLYHHYLVSLLKRKCGRSLRMLEIGLSCGTYGALGNNNAAGGSVRGCKALFPSSLVQLDYHVMELNGNCVTEWAKREPADASGVKLHSADQSNITDLKRVYNESGGTPFDLVIDDGSHMNAHQIFTAQAFLSNGWLAADGGVLIIEDIHSACKSFTINEPTRWATGQGKRRAGSTRDCLGTDSSPTILWQILEWQRKLVKRQLPFPGVRHIDMFEEAVAFEVRVDGQA